MDTTTVTPTIAAIVGQMQENTGRHMLDSGDAYGRGFERKAGIPAEAFAAAPAVRVDENMGVTLDVTHWLADRVEIHAEGNAFFHEWVEADDADLDRWDKRPWLVSMERFAAWVLTGDPEGEDRYGENSWSYNTYNGESLLSETLQWVAFRVPDDWHEAHEGEPGHWSDDTDDAEWIEATEPPAGLVPGEWYLLLQTHNGCDVRGGYSAPVLYAITGGEGYYDLYDQDSFELYCEAEHDPEVTGSWGTGYYLSHRGGEWTDSSGSFTKDPWEGLVKGVVTEGGSRWDAWPLIRTAFGGAAIQCPMCFLPMQAGPTYVG